MPGGGVRTHALTKQLTDALLAECLVHRHHSDVPPHVATVLLHAADNDAHKLVVHGGLHGGGQRRARAVRIAWRLNFRRQPTRRHSCGQLLMK